MENWEKRILKIEQSFAVEECVENLPGVLIRVLEWNNRRRVVIELADDTTSKDLRQAIPYALDWQKKVRQTTMPYSRRKQVLLLDLYDNAQREGMTYREIAEKINSQVATQLKKSISNRYALIFVYDDLRTFGFSLEEIDHIVKDALASIKRGEEPFEREYPVDRERMIRILKYWRKVIKSNEVWSKPV